MTIEATDGQPGDLLLNPTPGRAPLRHSEVRSYLRQDFEHNTGAARITLTLFRHAQWLERSRDHAGLLPLRKLVSFTRNVWAAVSHIEMPPSVECGPGLHLAHGGYGLVLHANVSLGRSCHLYQGVTIGMRGTSHRTARLGDGVVVFANAVIAGAVSVGDGAQVGANVVLTSDLATGQRATANAYRVR